MVRRRARVVEHRVRGNRPRRPRGRGRNRTAGTAGRGCDIVEPERDVPQPTGSSTSSTALPVHERPLRERASAFSWSSRCSSALPRSPAAQPWVGSPVPKEGWIPEVPEPWHSRHAGGPQDHDPCQYGEQASHRAPHSGPPRMRPRHVLDGSRAFWSRSPHRRTCHSCRLWSGSYGAVISSAFQATARSSAANAAGQASMAPITSGRSRRPCAWTGPIHATLCRREEERSTRLPPGRLHLGSISASASVRSGRPRQCRHIVASRGGFPLLDCGACCNLPDGTSPDPSSPREAPCVTVPTPDARRRDRRPRTPNADARL